MSYVLEQGIFGYEAGTELRDVTLREARAMECNRCGGCCSGLLPDDVVKKDPTTGLPLFIWGSNLPDDNYKERYGKPMLQPIGFLDNSDEMPYQGRIGLVEAFEKDEQGQSYNCFSCTFHSMGPDGAVCELKEKHGDGDPTESSTTRPLNCGEFPVFSPGVDNTLIDGHSYVPATGALPQCTWHGIRIVGPYRDTHYWRNRWSRQQAGLEVADLSIQKDFIEGLQWKAKQNNGR